jgi:GGDEF domain-containing protein
LNELGDGAGWVLVPLKLVNLDRFRDAYGFVASDDVVRAVALMIQNAIRDLGNSNDFIGQLNPSQFILVLSADTADQVVRRIRSRLEQSLDYFYPIKDRLPGRLDDERLQIKIKQYLPGEVLVTDSDSVKRYLMI